MKVNLDMEDLPSTLHWIDIRTGEVITEQSIETFPVEIDVPEFNDGILGHMR